MVGMFLLMPALVGGVTGGAVVFALARRHLTARNSLLAAASACLVLGLGWYFTTWIALAGAIVAIVVYGISRIWTRVSQALVAACGTYLVFTIGVGYLLYAALDAMG